MYSDYPRLKKSIRFVNCDDAMGQLAQSFIFALGDNHFPNHLIAWYQRTDVQNTLANTQTTLETLSQLRPKPTTSAVKHADNALLSLGQLERFLTPSDLQSRQLFLTRLSPKEQQQWQQGYELVDDKGIDIARFQQAFTGLLDFFLSVQRIELFAQFPELIPSEIKQQNHEKLLQKTVQQAREERKQPKKKVPLANP